MIFVFDSSPLIYLARSGALRYILEYNSENYLPPMVYREVVTLGRAEGYPDAEITDLFIHQGLLRIKESQTDSAEIFAGLHRDLHVGEREVLALAGELNGIAILDDRIGREIGGMLRIEVRGSGFILFILVKNGIISKEKAKQILQVMIHEGFRIGAEQYGAILDMLDQISDKK